jgi:hypothetical protein
VYWFEAAIEIVFIIDLGVNFRTGYFVEEMQNGESVKSLTVEFDPSKVAVHYLRSWFILDSTSAIVSRLSRTRK